MAKVIYASWSKLSPSSSYGKNVKERKHLHHQSLSISSGEENVRFMNANISITPENMHAHLTQSEKHALTYSCPFVRVRVESRPRFTSNLSCQVCIIIPSTSDFFTFQFMFVFVDIFAEEHSYQLSRSKRKVVLNIKPT